ncbi:hypothetical protein KGQ27_00005, partial [Patescibacteria group bacterium]|nr:hypothetical protein [Patescibacteria group bacterium]
RPLLRAGNQPRQGESIPPDKLFRPAESILLVLIIWILLEIVSNFVQQTPHYEVFLTQSIMPGQSKPYLCYTTIALAYTLYVL